MSTTYRKLVDSSKHIPPFLLAGILFLGAFSRLTHGQYTPWWYEMQEYHVKDDDSAIATITPIMDTILGTLIFWKPTRFVACGTVLVLFGVGLGGQVKANKRIEFDLFLITIANIATLISWQESSFMRSMFNRVTAEKPRKDTNMPVQRSPAHDLRRRR